MGVYRVYVCLCFGVTEQQVRTQIEGGASSPRQIASSCGAGTDCGNCVRRIQTLLGRQVGWTRRPGTKPALLNAPMEPVAHPGVRAADGESAAAA